MTPGRLKSVLLLVALWVSGPLAFTQAGDAAATASDEHSAPKRQHPTSRAWGTRLESEPPGYVTTLDRSGMLTFKDVDWLDFGLEQRTRYEYRSDLRRPDLTDDQQFLLRTRMYLGVHDIVDPFRFAIEVQDARQFNSEYGDSSRDVNQADVLQAFAELYFEDALGEGYPLQFRAGRMTLEYVDRRLVGRNRWRNTVNAFDGFRLRMGQPTSDWQVDVFAVQPVESLMSRPDRPDEERWLYGVVGAWRGWSDRTTIEPYYFVLDEDRKNSANADREIHTLGFHLFGPIGKTRFDYDMDAAFQFGDDGARRHRAFAAYGELGYTFAHPWKPRLAFAALYATGDRNPDDNTTERFDRLFEVTHPYSTTDLFAWQNAISPKLLLALRPSKTLTVDTSYGAYWLASDADAWPIAGLRDSDGRSGDFIGQELELRVRCQLDRRVELEAGYAHFFPGAFVRNTSDADDGDLFYVQTTIHF